MFHNKYAHIYLQHISIWTSRISSAQQLHIVGRCHIDRAIVDDDVSTIHSRVHFSALPGVVCTYSFLDLFIIGCLPCVRLCVRLKVSKSKRHIFKNIMTVSQDKYNRRSLCKLLWKHGRKSIKHCPGQEDSIRLKNLHCGDK